MNEHIQKQAYIVWGLFVALAANAAVVGVTVWEHKTSTDNDLWVSGTYLGIVFGATALALVMGLPFNISALVHYWRNGIWPKVVVASLGAGLSLSPWLMPTLVERVVFGW